MVPVSSLAKPNIPHMPGATFYGCRIHLIGIGGCGMSNVSQVLLRQGAQISGSDRSASSATLRLQSLGAHVRVGGHHSAGLPTDTELVVRSAAIPEDNPEIGEARRRGLEIIGYAELVGRLMAAKIGVAVAGTHGKTTTTAMTAFALRAGGKDPTFVVGADVPQLNGGSGVGCGQHFIVEACEFNRSFHSLRPRQAVILNIEEDHLDYYRDLDEISGAFGEFARQVPADGLLLVNGDDARSLSASEDSRGTCERFALESPAEWRASDARLENGCFGFGVHYRDRHLGEVQLGIPGRHNVYNALAAFALAWHGGAKPDRICEALSEFAGCERRLSCRGRGRGVVLLDDYAHHPTEIRASLAAARERYEPRSVWAVFQPHQHSRTRFLLDDFAQSFALADHIVVPDIYFVRDSETERTRIGAADLVRRIRENGQDARHIPDFEGIADLLAERVGSGDLVITMGAGDVWKLADELTARLELERV